MEEQGSWWTPEAFDPSARRWVPLESAGSVPVPRLDGELVCDEPSLRWASDDFGHLVHHSPRAVARPVGTADVAAIVAFAGRAGLDVAARGAGHSPYGQAQVPGGIVIDMAGLDLVDEVDADRVRVQAGARWSDVVDITLTAGRTPPVLTDHAYTSVGGTLSVGGVGGTSHRHGFQVDHVEELTVVTGAGEVVTCSADRDRRLFDAVRGGLGQFGVITEAVIRVVPAPERARFHRLPYQDRATFLEDQQRLMREGRFDFLQGHVVSAESGRWQYLLEAASYYTSTPPDDTALLGGLGCDRAGREVRDLTYRDFVHRMTPGEAMLRASGEWRYPHAWFTAFLPSTTADPLVGEVLGELAEDEVAELRTTRLAGLLFPIRAGRPTTSFPCVPESDPIWVFSVLRSASPDDPARAPQLVSANRVILDKVTACGGVAYPINAVPMRAEDWCVHFGLKWDEWRAAKREFDPHGILTPGQHQR